MTEQHFRNLEELYVTAPINALDKPEIQVSNKECRITAPVLKELYHGGGSLHGSVYFKMLDDSAFFAAQSVETVFFLLTAQFNINLFRPVIGGEIKATGRVLVTSRQQYSCESKLIDEKGKLVAKGQGIFMKSSMPLEKLFRRA
jgi:uncharacterized protein (TIGR00369 family)